MNLLWPNPADIAGISDHQRDALARTFAGRVGILTGGPGTGKTRTAAALLRVLIEQCGSASVAVAAPTGMAAVRITEAMAENGVQVTATTIHRLLGVMRNGHDGKGWGFAYHAENPLPYRFVMIDELSMCDTDLAASLFGACQVGTHVFLIGDPGQLPPVGHGAPLRDLIAAGVPHGELTETWRNAGDIVLACQAIRAGRAWQPSEYLDLEGGHNFKHLETKLATHALRHLESLLATVPSGYDPVWDVQVLCAIKENSDVCKEALNQRLQAMLNPTAANCEGSGNGKSKSRFRLRDKVICLSNTWLPLVDDTGAIVRIGGEEVTDFVANGEVGGVVQLDTKAKRLDVSFPSPRRTVAVRGAFVEQFDLAYALTVHKSQGSQWPVVIFMADEARGARFVGCRELIYTALSRAQKLAVTIGRKATIDQDCRRVALVGRKTFLRELVRERLGIQEGKECVAA